MEILKVWCGYLVSVFFGFIGWIGEFKAVLDVVFVLVGIVGLLLSSVLTYKKIKALR